MFAARCLLARRSCLSSRVSVLPRRMASTSNAGMNNEPVLFRSDLASRTFVLNRPDKLNALNEPMIDLLRPQIQEWNSGNLCKVIIGTGTGSAFCAGGDVRHIVKCAANESTRPEAVRFFQKEFELDYQVSTLSKPYVAILDGVTMGGGVGLSVHAPFRIATENTVFAMPETKIGYFPDVGGSHFLSRLDGEVGTYLALTGAAIKGRAVFQLGLATHFVSSRRIQSLIDRLSSLEDATPERVNDTLEEFFSEPVADEASPILVGPIRAALDSAFSRNTVEEIVAALEKLQTTPATAEGLSVAEWANAALADIHARSPTSLKVALEAVRRGKFMDLRESLQMDMRLATAFCSGATSDFITGVETLLGRRSKERPEWDPKSLPEVSNEKVLADFFNPDSPFVKTAPKLDLPFRGGEKYNHMRFALPTEADIGKIIQGAHGTSSSTGVNVLELSGMIEGMWNGKNGVREKVFEVASRRCSVDPSDGFNHLKWKL